MGGVFINKNCYAIFPLDLINNEQYHNLSSDEKILYILLLNRKNFSLKNLKSFSDEKGVFIYYCNSQIQKHLNCCESTATKCLKNLEDAGLIIKEYQKNKQPIIKVEDITKTNFEDMYINRFLTHTRAFVKIQDGCNAFCAYCTIPYARGGLRSKEFNKVIDEVTNLVNNGYKEIVLTGIHTGRYGIEQNTNLEKLLKELVKIKNIFRIRLSSIEINEITDGIIELIKTNDIMAKHLHIPLQSGSNKILKDMNRLYDLEFFINRIEYIKKEIPDISITTDLIVGFPGETEELFKETLDTLNKIKFTKIHTFPYSKRKGTPAASMDNQISPEIKKERVRKVLELSSDFEQKYYENNIGKIYDGVVEVHQSGEIVVHTSNFIPVIINNNLNNNDIVKVEITEMKNNKVYGKVVK